MNLALLVAEQYVSSSAWAGWPPLFLNVNGVLVAEHCVSARATVVWGPNHNGPVPGHCDLDSKSQWPAAI